MTFTTVAQGTRSEISESRLVIARTAAEWQKLWKEHDSRPVPEVDFSRSIVVGVFLGTRPTAGYGVTITAVTAKDGSAIVDYAEQKPSPGRMTAQVLTSPFHLVSVPKEIEKVEFRRVEKQ
ncbi:MAG: protease complex subunit PrcB family protein [Acidobacteriota bacterium]